MKIAVIADIHDNLPRLEEALKRTVESDLKTCVCLGDVSRLEVLEVISNAFEKVYLTFGNMDYNLKKQTGLFPENVEWFPEEGGEFKIRNKKIFIVHYDFLARKAAETGKFDLVFYGHTHTPWEKKIGKTILLNPGEIAGQFGQASFAIYDLTKLEGKLEILA